MNRICMLMAAVLVAVVSFAQPGNAARDTSWKAVYRSATDKVNDLVHTKLDAKFDFSKSYLNGKAWITLQTAFLCH